MTSSKTVKPAVPAPIKTQRERLDIIHGDLFEPPEESTNSAILALQAAECDAAGIWSYTWSDITSDWAPWQTPPWFSLDPGGTEFTISELGFYTAHPLAIVTVPDPVPAGVFGTAHKIYPASGAYISEAWAQGADFMQPLGGAINAWGWGLNITFNVVSGPGTDPSHRPGVEVNDPAVLRSEIYAWSDGAKTASIFGGTLQITKIL